MKNFCIAIVFLLINQTLFAQFDTSKLSTLLMNYEANNKAMMSIAVSSKGKVLYERAIGYSDIEHSIKSNTETTYHIGSITKMFTAVIMFQLIDEKKISIDTKLGKYFPGIPNSSKITIGNMLNHHSGLHNFVSDSNYLQYMSKPHTQQELVAMFEKQGSDFKPGSKGQYSNTNYVLLGFIIEKICGTTYDEQLQKRICKKIGLQKTSVSGPINSKNHEAISYEFHEQTWHASDQTDMSIPGAAGSIISTPKELCKFIEALFVGKFMSDSSFTMMKTIDDYYGSGILQFPYEKKKAYGHNGGLDGFQSMLIYIPEDSVALAITGNAWNYQLNNVAMAALNIYYGKPFVQPEFSKKPIPNELKKTIEGNYSNESLGMKISIRKVGESYEAQATGQNAFPLEKISELEYHFKAGGVKIIFKKDAEGNVLMFNLQQAGQDLKFEKVG